MYMYIVVSCVTDCEVERSVLTVINEYVMLCYVASGLIIDGG